VVAQEGRGKEKKEEEEGGMKCRRSLLL